MSVLSATDRRIVADLVARASLAAAGVELGDRNRQGAHERWGGEHGVRELRTGGRHAEPGNDDQRDDREALTSRERQVAALVAEGWTNVEIADRLEITPLTATTYVKHVIRKLGARNRVQAAVLFVRSASWTEEEASAYASMARIGDLLVPTSPRKT